MTVNLDTCVRTFDDTAPCGEPAASLPPGTRLGPYEVVALLGAGGMGEVYRALDTRLNRVVALKVVSTPLGREPDFKRRFEREARAAASLTHPNICTLLDVGRHEDTDFLVMECLEGETLAARLARGPMPLGEALQQAGAMLAGLAAIHERGLVHRDLKPSNVFLTAHGLKLLDFGLARAVSPLTSPRAAEITQPGIVMGTPRYMAPEALRGRTIDARADLFAAGCLLYEMLSGRPAFAGDSVIDVAQLVLHDEPPALGGGAAAVERVIRRALAKRVEDRYQSAASMAEDLRVVDRHGSGAQRVFRPVTRLMVLPFRLLRPDSDLEFLSFSLADSIAGSLAGLSSLIVRSSLVAARCAGSMPDLGTIAREAGVDVVLVGTLLPSGSSLRLTAQLVEAPAGTVIWSQVTQATLDDIFRFQDDLSRRIVESLALPLTMREHQLVGRDVPAHPKAFEHYLRANQICYEPAQWGAARALYQRCLEEDPQYAPAWARLGRMHLVFAKFVDDNHRAGLERAEYAFSRALAINPDLPLAHNLYAYLKIDRGRAEEAMTGLIARAKKVPSDAELFAGLVQACRVCGLLEASAAAHDRARALDGHVATSVGYTYFWLNDYDRLEALTLSAFDQYLPALADARRKDRARALERLAAIVDAQKNVTTSGAVRIRDIALMLKAAILRRRRECLEATDRIVLRLWDAEGFYFMASACAHVGDPDRALEAFRRAVEAGFLNYPAAAGDPWLQKLRGLPAFDDLIEHTRRRHQHAAMAFAEAGGGQLLGLADQRQPAEPPPPADADGLHQRDGARPKRRMRRRQSRPPSEDAQVR